MTDLIPLFSRRLLVFFIKMVYNCFSLNFYMRKKGLINGNLDRIGHFHQMVVHLTSGLELQPAATAHRVKNLSWRPKIKGPMYIFNGVVYFCRFGFAHISLNRNLKYKLWKRTCRNSYSVLFFLCLQLFIILLQLVYLMHPFVTRAPVRHSFI